jgi:hypothetical protein
MSAREWFVDAMLGSPIPPPRWLGEDAPESGPYVLQDAAQGMVPALLVRPIIRTVSAAEIRADQEDIRAHINRPILQGWAFWLAIVVIGAEVFDLVQIRGADGLAVALWLAFFAAAPIAWLALVLLAGRADRVIERRGRSILVRRWTDVWFGRTGAVLGPADEVKVAVESEGRVRLSGPHGEALVSTALWPSSSRRDLGRHLTSWGARVQGAEQLHRRRRHHGGRRPRRR